MIVSKILSKLLVVTNIVSCVFVIVVPIVVVVPVVLAQNLQQQNQQQHQKINILLQIRKYTLPTVLTKSIDNERKIEYYKIQSYHFLCSIVQDNNNNTLLYDSITITTTIPPPPLSMIETITTQDYTTTTNNNRRAKLYQQKLQQYYCCYAIYKWINNNNTIKTISADHTEKDTHSNNNNYITTTGTSSTVKTTTATTSTTSSHFSTNVLYTFNIDNNINEYNTSSSNLFCTKNKHKIIKVRRIITDTITTTTTIAETGQLQLQQKNHHFFPTYSMILSNPIVHVSNCHSKNTTTTGSNTTTTHSLLYKYINQLYQSLISPTLLSSSLTTTSNTVSLNLLHTKKTNDTNSNSNNNNNNSINVNSHNKSNNSQKIDVMLNSTISETGGMHRIIHNYLQINSMNRNKSSSLSSSLLYKNTINISVILLLHIPRTIFINLDDALTSIKVIDIQNNNNNDCTEPSVNDPSTSSTISSPQNTDQCCNDGANSMSLINDIEWTTKSLTILSHKTSSSSSASSLQNMNDEVTTQHSEGTKVDNSNADYSTIDQYSINNDDDSNNIDQEEPSFSQRSKEHVIIIQFNAIGEQKQWKQTTATNTNWTAAFEFGIKIHTRYPSPITNNNSDNNDTSETTRDTETLYDGNFLLVPIIPPQIIAATVQNNNIVSILRANNNNMTIEQDTLNDKTVNSNIDMNIVTDDEQQLQQQYEYCMNTNYNHHDNDTVNDSSLLYLWVATGNVNHSIYVICITLLLATLGTARIMYDILQVQ